jgi:hypothetical protein
MFVQWLTSIIYDIWSKNNVLSLKSQDFKDQSCENITKLPKEALRILPQTS